MGKKHQQESENLASEIAAAWYVAISNTSPTPLNPEEVKIRLEEMAGEALLLLQDDLFSAQKARLIGAELVNLHFDQPDSLNVSIQVLKEHLIDQQPPKRKLPPNIPSLFEEITFGFVEQSQKSNRPETNQPGDIPPPRMIDVALDQQVPHQTTPELTSNGGESKRKKIAALRDNEDHFQVLFDESPLPMTLFDMSLLFHYQEKLRQSGVKDFAMYLEENPDGIYTFSKFVQVIDINRAAIGFLKAGNKDLIFHNHTMLLPLGGEQLMKEIIFDMWQGVKSNKGEFSGYTLSGTRSTALYNWSVLSDYEQDYSRIILSFVDITAQKEAEDALALNALRLKVLVEIESNILAAESPKDIADLAINILLEIIPCQSASISLYDFDKSQIVILSSKKEVIPSGATLPMTSSQGIININKNSNLFEVEKLQSFEKEYPILEEVIARGVKSVLHVPLVFRESLIGSLNLTSEESHGFSEEDITFANQIAGLIAIAIYNNKLIEGEKKARQEAETLQEVSSILNENLRAEDLLNLILRQLERVIPYDNCSIGLISDNTLYISAQRGIEQDIDEHINQSDSLPPNIKRLIQHKEPVIIADTHQDPLWIFFPGGDYIRCWMGIPLMIKGHLLGLLMLDKMEPNFYSTSDSKLALAFANQAAIALENAQLVREAQRLLEQTEQQVVARTRDLSTLYEVTALSSQQLDLSTKIDKALTIILDSLGCEIGVILNLDSATNKLRVISWQGLTPEIAKFAYEVPVDNPFIKGLIQDGKPIVIENIDEDPRAASLPLLTLKTPHIIAAPMRFKGEVLGLVSIASIKLEPFSREDVALLCSVADQIGAAIEEDRLRKQDEKLVLLQERERLARDLHDSATQSLFSLSLFAAGARELLQLGEMDQAIQYMKEIDNTANQIHKELRLMLYELKPSVLKEEGLVGAVHHRLETVEDRSGISRKVHVDLPAPIPEDIEETLFRVLLEALNNVLKHAEASDVRIDLQAQNGLVKMIILDNGRGFSMDSLEVKRGMGISNMKQRVKDIQGSIEIVSAKGQGTEISVQIPIPAEKTPPENNYAGND